jgi:endonuclease/exonuclease/phosphatase family metal-dependent hydrolase
VVKNIFFLKTLFSCIILLLACCTGGPDHSDLTDYYENINDTFVYTDSNSIVCMTWNVQLGFRLDDDPWDKNNIGATAGYMDELVDAVNSIDCDILLLQEVPFERPNCETQDFVKYIGEHLNMNYAYGSHSYNNPDGVHENYGQWGNAVLSKYYIKDLEKREIFRRDAWERRSVVKVVLKLNDTMDLDIYSIHLYPGCSTNELESSVSNVLDFIDESQNPIIAAGDFNIQPENEFIDVFKTRLVETVEALADSQAEYIEENGTVQLANGIKGVRIDYIFISPGVFTIDYMDLLDEQYWDLSDHIGYYNTFYFE